MPSLSFMCVCGEVFEKPLTQSRIFHVHRPLGATMGVSPVVGVQGCAGACGAPAFDSGTQFEKFYPPPQCFGDPVCPNQPETVAQISGFLAVAAKKTI